MNKILLLVSFLLLSLCTYIFGQDDAYTVEVKSFRTSTTLPDNPDHKDTQLRKRAIRYSGDKAFDNRKDTVWAEGDSGSGIGETLTISLEKKIPIDEIAIMAGFFDGGLFNANNRIKQFKLETGDGSWSQVFICKDIQKRQRIKLSRKISSDKLIFTILSVYKGSRWDDTCLAELIFSFKDKDYNLLCNRLNYRGGKYTLSIQKRECRILILEESYPRAIMTLWNKGKRAHGLKGKLAPGTQTGAPTVEDSGSWSFSDDGTMILQYSYYKMGKHMGDEEGDGAYEPDPVITEIIRIVLLGDSSEDGRNWYGGMDFICEKVERPQI